MTAAMPDRLDQRPSEGRAGSNRTGGALALLVRWIERSVDQDRFGWFRAMLAAVAEAKDDRVLLRAVGLAPRKLGKADLLLSADDLRQAQEVRPGFDPRGLSVDQAARIAFVLASDRGDDAVFAAGLETLCRTAEINELIAYYRGLAIFPGAPFLRQRAAEGVRSAMKPVFEAVAHRNPFPREMFDQNAWNQMVLKALFIETTLAPIQGIDERANEELARMLVDYAHERWAAGRPVSPELWRCVGPYAGTWAIADLARVLHDADPVQQQAATLALAQSPEPEAADLLALRPDLQAALSAGRLSWDSLTGHRTGSF